MAFDYIDIHSHLYFPDFDADRESEIAKLKENKIAAITIGTDIESSEKAIALAEVHENLFATVGWHPGDLPHSAEFPTELEKLLENNKVVAIGECGLDYYREAAADMQLRGVQKKIFQAHIDLALKADLPLMLHVRPQKGSQDAYHDALQILEAELPKSGGKLRGNVHFFVGDLDVLKRFLKIGFTVSFTGVITFAHDYDEIIRSTPLDMLMSETDSPFVAPASHRGQRNSPLYVPEIVRKIAEIRGEDFETVRKQLLKNAERVFKITL